jgi:bifunctional DNA-binding transcriptional regulator/antitoxin component of YhaV-PrlF toxin-antitoxin module
MDFDYKNYALQRLEEWLHDCMSSGEATPQEIYDTIKNVVQEQYDYYKNGAEKTNELLALLNGNGKGHIKAYDDYIGDGMKPWGHSDLEFGLANSFLTQDRISNFPGENTVCDKNDSSPECKSSWNSFWEENYYPEEYYKSVTPSATQREIDKVTKWRLPVEVDAASDEYYVQFPDDLLEAANLKEGDKVEWVDQGDGSYLLRKVDELARVKTYKEIGNELAKVKTYQEMIDDGWTMTADGFWIKE